ncbi:MAG: RNA-guided endonuclease TnpB family protein [Xenococcaceae cyanobacterium MO_188.B32]|nr:RNA-guided endonuclease TnpB family protein [Xenococcaceae cyanobacterium MO_188.B32]
MSYLSYKTKLKLNNQQKTLMRQCAGYSRWLWNWGLDFKQKAYSEGIKLNKALVRKFYTNYIKPDYPWQSQLSSRIYQYVFIDLDEAFKRFYRGVANYPRFKKKGKSRNSFTIDAGGKAINLGGKLHKLPFFSWLKTYEKLPICSTKKITFSEKGGDWFISFFIEVDFLPTPKNREKVGVDLGISKLATLSSGVVFENPKAYNKALKRLARLQRDLSRKVFQSSNWYKAKLRVAKAHRKIADIRQNAIDHLTSYLAKNHGEITIEDLNVAGLVKNRHLSQALSDAAFGITRTQLEYKTSRYGSNLIIADRFFPSSQLCSNCGHRQKMPLKIRTYACPHCFLRLDRDFNASLNLENYTSNSRVLSAKILRRVRSSIAVGLTALRSVDGVLPTVPREADSKHQASLSSFG